MKLKLKTVFVLYFMVSLLGLVYALMQLGEWMHMRLQTVCRGGGMRTFICSTDSFAVSLCRSALRLRGAQHVQRSYHISAAGGPAPSSGAN